MNCTWCGTEVQPHDGYHLSEHASDRGAVFCRLEHVVPWAIQGARWEAHWKAAPTLEPGGTDGVTACAHCGEPLGDGHLLLVRHRGEYRIPDRFCSIDHLLAWAKAGGRWQT
jgi:hypothetical protein